MNVMFQPKRGDGRPLYRVVFDHIESKMNSGAIQVNDLILDSELKPLFRKDELDRFYSENMKAAKKLEEQYNRTLVRERRRGYRLTGGEGQIDYSSRYKKRSNKALKRSFSLATTTDAGLLTAEGRTKLDKHTRAIGFLLIQQKMTDEKLAAQESQMNALREQQASAGYRQTVTEQDITELKRRLAEIEAERKAK